MKTKQTKTCKCCGQEIKEDIAITKAIVYLRDKDWEVDEKDFKKAVEGGDAGEIISILYRDCDWQINDTLDVKCLCDALDIYHKEKKKEYGE
jgi:hypothetical protein